MEFDEKNLFRGLHGIEDEYDLIGKNFFILFKFFFKYFDNKIFKKLYYFILKNCFMTLPPFSLYVLLSQCHLSVVWQEWVQLGICTPQTLYRYAMYCNDFGFYFTKTWN
jgi:hypothetical protein